MQWNNEINCHGKPSGVFKIGEDGWKWRAAEPDGRAYDKEKDPRGLPGPYGYPFRTCEWDGSMHPEDLYNWLLKGATAHGADWKYGWPHKFYIENIPNPLAGKDVCNGGQYNDKGFTPHYGKGPDTTTAKFYNEHLSDVTDDEAFTALTNLLLQQTDILFFKKEGKLLYRSPVAGYQR